MRKFLVSLILIFLIEAIFVQFNLMAGNPWDSLTYGANAAVRNMNDFYNIMLQDKARKQQQQLEEERLRLERERAQSENRSRSEYSQSTGKQALIDNWNKGFESGYSKGYQRATDDSNEYFKKRIPDIEVRLIESLGQSIFTEDSVKTLTDVKSNVELNLKQNPNYFDKVYSVLINARLKELTKKTPVKKK